MIRLSQKWDAYGMSALALALAHLTITYTKQFIAKLDFISCMIYTAMLPDGGYQLLMG